jgi:tRNA (guanine37-N1)-methyltransferase
MLQLNAVTIFPELFEPLQKQGVVGRAFERGLVSLNTVNPRQFTQDNYHRIDDRPYGGGPGMVMLAEPLDQALQGLLAQAPQHFILLSPQGRPATDARVREWLVMAQAGQQLSFICGRYEGIDQRLLDKYHALGLEEVCVGDFVVSGGELPAMMLMDALIRLWPGALNDEMSAQQDSFADGLLDCPHYTRPEVWQDQAVPAVLLSGNHAQIESWRRAQSVALTQARRPELLASLPQPLGKNLPKKG